MCGGDEDSTYESSSPIWVSIFSRLRLNCSELILEVVLKVTERIW